MAANSGSVSVSVRVRPAGCNERAGGIEADCDNATVTVPGLKAPLAYVFDHVLPASASQRDLFDSVAAPIARGTLDGFNGTILTYGQTGSGKSFTCFGEGDGDARGLVPRTLEFVFAQLAAKAAQRTRTQTDGATMATTTTTTATTTATSCSFVEIYNEKVFDLLAAEAAASGADGSGFGSGGGGGGPGLELRLDKKGRVIVDGLDEVRVASAADALRVLTAATCRRRVRTTAMNDVSRCVGVGGSRVSDDAVHTDRLISESDRRGRGIRCRLVSRSHAVFTLRVTTTTCTTTGTTTAAGGAANPSSGRSKFGFKPSAPPPSSADGGAAGGGSVVRRETDALLRIVDLAGSERQGRTKITDAAALAEANNINKSLTTLGMVVTTLAAKRDSQQAAVHVPYRSSKLTWLLRDSLGGNARTAFVATVSPAHANLGETIGA